MRKMTEQSRMSGCDQNEAMNESRQTVNRGKMCNTKGNEVKGQCLELSKTEGDTKQQMQKKKTAQETNKKRMPQKRQKQATW